VTVSLIILLWSCSAVFSAALWSIRFGVLDSGVALFLLLCGPFASLTTTLCFFLDKYLPMRK